MPKREVKILMKKQHYRQQTMKTKKKQKISRTRRLPAVTRKTETKMKIF